LFAERAATAKHDFILSDEQVGDIADICRRLDGVALAIELAAARLPVLGPSELRAQLTKHFLVVSGGRHDLPARQRTLNATIAWSHDLLGEPERVLFRRLAVFASGWTLEAAESVCVGGALHRESVLDALCSLAEKPLVVVAFDVATPRYSFFESTRAYALERLVADGEHPEFSRRHAEWMATFADRAYGMYGVVPRSPWQIAVIPELDNALAALEWALRRDGDALLDGRIASGLPLAEHVGTPHTNE
jgi:predicted ATPase